MCHGCQRRYFFKPRLTIRGGWQVYRRRRFDRMFKRTRKILRYKYRWALFLALLNAISFCVATAIPTTVDPMLPTRSKLYISNYPLGYGVLLLAVPIFIFTYIANTKVRKAHYKAFSTFLAITIVMIVFLPNFDPMPHTFVVWSSMISGFILAVLSYVHYSKIDHKFLDDNSIDPMAKIEKLKTEHETWSKFLTLFITSVVATAVIAMFWSVESFSGSPQETRIITLAIHGSLLWYMVITALVVWQLFLKLRAVSEDILKIKRT